MTGWIDPQRIPFTIVELRTAFHRWRPAEEAELRLESTLEEAAMDRELAGARDEAGDDDSPPASDALDVVDRLLEDELLACLRLVSSSAAARVDQLMVTRWADARRSALMRAQFEAAVRRGDLLSEEDILERELLMLERGTSGASGASGGDDERAPTPRPAGQSLAPMRVTPEVTAAAEASVARLRAQWETLCEAAERGAIPEPEPNALMELWRVGALPDAGFPPDWARIDGYLALMEEMHRRGKSRDDERAAVRALFGRFVRERDSMNAAMLHALGVAPREALPRLVMYVAAGTFTGGLPLVEPLGVAAQHAFAAVGVPAPALGPVGPDGDAYYATDLWIWLATHRAALEVPPVVEAWRTTRRTDLDARMAVQVRRMRGKELPDGWIRATEGLEG